MGYVHINPTLHKPFTGPTRTPCRHSAVDAAIIAPSLSGQYIRLDGVVLLCKVRV